MDTLTDVLEVLCCFPGSKIDRLLGVLHSLESGFDQQSIDHESQDPKNKDPARDLLSLVPTEQESFSDFLRDYITGLLLPCTLENRVDHCSQVSKFNGR